MSALSDHDDHSEELFADGGHASTTAPRRTAPERDPQLERIPVDQLDSGKLVVRQQPSATNRARIRWLTLARAGAAIPTCNWSPLPLSSTNLRARGRPYSSIARLRRTAAQAAGNLELRAAGPRNPPGRGTPASSVTNTAPRHSRHSTSRTRQPARSAPAALAPLDPPDPEPAQPRQTSLGPQCHRTPLALDPCLFRTCRSFEALTAPATVISPTSGHPRRWGSAESLRPPFAYSSATAAWLQPRGLTSQLSMLKPPPH
jgi:hypothetical protein